ncbi:MAG: hypothetical protein J7K72_02400 [Candidatus Aenigmarchaeota archaeon]|nr:hypothetical protein [Candidatus Aenigmarchaeota archaeon]
MEEGVPNPQLIFNLSSNKEIYHSSDEMQLTLTIKASMNIENLTIKIRGVKDRFGHYRIKTEKVINLTEPESTEIFKFRVPSCYGCAGVSPGEYKIVTKILKNGELIGNLSKTIKLEK